MENNAQLLKGVLEYCVLKLIAQEPTYGYEIVMHLKQVGFSDLSESTLYPLLLRLEQQGKVTVERRPSPKGPSRKYYIVTEEGRRAHHSPSPYRPMEYYPLETTVNEYIFYKTLQPSNVPTC